MTEYLFKVQVAQLWSLDSRPQGQELFSKFIILLKLSHDVEKNEVPVLKIEDFAFSTNGLKVLCQRLWTQIALNLFLGAIC